MNFKFSNHALEEMEKRKVPISFVEAVLENPQQTLQQDEEITIYQSQIDFGTGKLYLLRVFINITSDPAIVVTVYRTSQIKKHWRNP
ncbi:MAG: DUF4258 domain-containing protein [Chroococcales cyanobacterium metabat2.561]|jgi:hypothetical protein|uniref:DUF4258 domain-containing protein n=1 Tax=Microcystis aeruginosa Ma_SC_T_19800800_S464 TaxID=2486257 RepID=A0A552DX59_MICAE|nr:MAG: DUF4258 domain-containing protein [Chroococcales cyanobacterium metabat2.561]TRT82828.1 MAG: DUF4258 domain-containing protein [Microcystis aeruginosa Ma_AC_P_19900807_S299]TRU26830.1 MAG: DUF4258 domain-containing protein [Microcystis aeruginosa Ma_SC_T_19800800_S464]